MDELNRSNVASLLSQFIKENNLTPRRVAGALGSSEATITRLMLGTTLPTDEMLKQAGIMFELGLPAYSRLSASERETLSDMIGAAGGGAIGFASIGTAISSLGLSGLSAAGITSGLAALGLGGGMVVGVTVAAAIPVAGAFAGYGIVQGVKAVFNGRRLDAHGMDPHWELEGDQ